MKRLNLPPYGVELIEGLPGSGKSMYAVRRLIRVILEQKRPVYTNLPLRWRVVRAYLRAHGGESCVGLIRELKRAHFDTFITRFAARTAWIDERLKKLAQGGEVGPGREELAAEWEKENGANVIEGDGANWIPHGSVVAIDECQYWYAMKDQANENRALLAYLSMHRHSLHWVWFITQDASVVSNSIRKMAGRWIMVRDMRTDRLVWGVTFGMLRMHPIGIAAYTGDQKAGRSGQQMKPIDNMVFFPAMPWNQWIFRLYDSFTNAGKLSAVLREMRKVRHESGVQSDECVSPQVVKLRRRRHLGRIVRLCRSVGKWAVRGALFGGVLVAGVGIGSAVSRKAPAAAAAPGPGAAAAPAGGAAGEPPKGDGPAVPSDWLPQEKLTGVGTDWVRVGRERVVKGGRYGAAELLSSGQRKSVWRVRDDVWVWELKSAPERLGTIQEISTVLRHRAATGAGGEAAGPNGRVPH